LDIPLPEELSCEPVELEADAPVWPFACGFVEPYSFVFWLGAELAVFGGADSLLPPPQAMRPMTDASAASLVKRWDWFI
jgi:hypothetical protein